MAAAVAHRELRTQEKGDVPMMWRRGAAPRVLSEARTSSRCWHVAFRISPDNNNGLADVFQRVSFTCCGFASAGPNEVGGGSTFRD